MRLLLLALFISVGTKSFEQDYLLQNEKLIYSFKTYSGKTLMIAQDSNEKYLVYRYGTDSLIELEYPKNKTNSWKKFKYSEYYRAGGVENLAMEMNFLLFDLKPYRYVVYWTYWSEIKETNCGIKVYNLSNDSMTDIKGDIGTVSGSLRALRWNELVSEEADFY